MHPVYNDFNYLYHDIIVHPELRTNYHDNKFSLSPRLIIHACNSQV